MLIGKPVSAAARPGGADFVTRWGDCLELVAMCDHNAKRAEHSRRTVSAPRHRYYSDVDQMFAEVEPELAIVCTPDDTHDDIIVKALEAGHRRRHREADGDHRGEVPPHPRRRARAPDGASTSPSTTAIAPTARRIKELLARGRDRRDRVGRLPLVSRHQARRRLLPPLARLRRELRQPVRAQGDAPFRPAELVARRRAGARSSRAATLRNYGRNGPFRGVALQGLRRMPSECDYLFRHRRGSLARRALRGAVGGGRLFPRRLRVPRGHRHPRHDERGDPATRTACRSSYSLNAFMPIEGYHLAFNGRKGRIEMRQYERQPWRRRPPTRSW